MPASSEPSSFPVADYDGAWKEALERFLSGLIEFFFPSVAAQLAWDQGFEFMDKELEEVVRDANLGKQRVDKLVKVSRKDGQEQLLLLHVEVASQSYVELGRTMYQYHHRLVDRYGLPVLSVAVLADDDPNWRPVLYEEDLMGCRLRFEFPMCKLLDFKRDWEALERSENVAAVIVMAHLRALETRRDMGRRFAYRWDLTKMLYERKYSREQIWELLRLIDWLLTLPPEMKLAYRSQVLEYEKQHAMPHVTIFEEVSRQEGLDEGLKTGLKKGQDAERSLVVRQLRRCLGSLDAPLQQAVEALPLAVLENLGEALFDFRSTADLQTWLEKAGG